MHNSTRHWLLFAFIVSFLAVGVPYWLIPYNSVSLPNALFAPGLFLVVCAPLILRLRSTSTFWRTVTIVGAAVPAAVFARVVWDGLADPTTHNLWPVELVIALILGISCALGGAIAGTLAAALSAKDNRSRKR